MTPDKLFKKIDEIERTHSLKELQEKAKKKGLSPSGTKREIVIRLFGKHARDYRPPAVPMTDRKHHQYGDKRTAFYIQYWAPKSDPEISQPYYYSGPEEGGTYKDLNQALRAASEVQRERPDAFQIDIYSQTEEWIAEAEDPRYGHWEIVEGTVKAYDLRGKLHYDEARPNYAPMTSSFDQKEVLPLLPVDQVMRERPHFNTPAAARRFEKIPRYWYHIPEGKADFGKVVKAYPIREIEAADSFGKGYRDGRYIWLSWKTLYGQDNVYIIDLMKLNNDNLRFTGQIEGNLLHKGDIPPEAVVAIMRRGQVVHPKTKYSAAPMTGAPTEDDLLKYYTVPPEAR